MVIPGDFIITYGRVACKRDGSGICLEAFSVLDGGNETDVEQAAAEEGPLHITLNGVGFHDMAD